jgi:DNA-binding CsgD family transcriptional regulator
MSDELKHYGTPRHSGRYPWGSGDDPHQRNISFLSEYHRLKKNGLTDKEISEGWGMNTTEFRQRRSVAKDEKRIYETTLANRLKDKGMSNTAIGVRMGIGESQVRNLLKDVAAERANITRTVANSLKDEVANKKYIDIGKGVENHIGISRTKLKTAVSLLEEEGYVTRDIQIPQPGSPGKYTTMKVIAAPGTDPKDIFKERDQIKMIGQYSEDGGKTMLGLEPIRSISSKNILIKYEAPEDGTIELRRGVPELDLGQARYAQVRIGVDETHFMKGVAMYNDNMPPGINAIYNSAKPQGTDKYKVFKPMEEDDENPFGAVVKQKHYIDEKGNKQLSALNIINQEGNWNEWSNTLSAQALSKQDPKVVRSQLDKLYERKVSEFDELNNLSNPTVRKKMLFDFAQGVDKSAEHLEGAAMPRQATHVILPFTSIKETEVFAPKYKDGEKVILIRYPHGGVFEIPELTVNNKNKDAIKTISKNAKDAIGINPKVAQQLSGADFDGDTVIVIPNQGPIRFKHSSALKELKDFDPKIMYKNDGSAKPLKATGKKMGEISNLITDMTIKGATEPEIARAVRHSMVVIDAEKHGLDYRRSYKDHGIAELQKTYQTGGTSTIISRAGAEVRMPKRKTYIDRATGKEVHVYSEETYTNKAGKTVKSLPTKASKMSLTDDAYSLSSGTVVENIYAEHANRLKKLANESRRLSVNSKGQAYNPESAVKYKSEVKDLEYKLNEALKRAPRERAALLSANAVIRTKIDNDPNLKPDRKKKLKAQALQAARENFNPNSKNKMPISDKEWEAIQAGAISNNKLSEILRFANPDRVRELATPRTTFEVSQSTTNRCKRLIANGASLSEAADSLGVSLSLVKQIMN